MANYRYITSFREHLQNHYQALRFVYIECPALGGENLVRSVFHSEELRFWRTTLNILKVRDCFLNHKPQHFVYSDASATGCGYLITLNAEHICHRLWEQSECSKNSTRRELAAIDFFSQIVRPSSGRFPRQVVYG